MKKIKEIIRAMIPILLVLGIWTAITTLFGWVDDSMNIKNPYAVVGLVFLAIFLIPLFDSWGNRQK